MTTRHPTPSGIAAAVAPAAITAAIMAGAPADAGIRIGV